MSGDSRKDFVLATTGNYFGIAPSDASLAKNTALNSFLDDGNVSVLVAKLDNSKKVILSNKVTQEGFCLFMGVLNHMFCDGFNKIEYLPYISVNIITSHVVTPR